MYLCPEKLFWPWIVGSFIFHGMVMLFFWQATLGELQDKQQEFGVADIQLGLTTLEEVFLNIARQVELETATAEGRMKTLTLTSGTLVQVSFNYVFKPLINVKTTFLG